jgi:hypothetical protein
MKPVRIQRKRTKGWKLPPNTVCVTRPGKWGNPFKVSDLAGHLDVQSSRAKQFVVDQFFGYMHTNPEKCEQARRELRGMNLACFCKLGEPCHADVLLDIANS